MQPNFLTTELINIKRKKQMEALEEKSAYCLDTFVEEVLERELLPFLDGIITSFGLGENEGRRMVLDAMEDKEFLLLVKEILITDSIKWAITMVWRNNLNLKSNKEIKTIAKERNISLDFLKRVLAMHKDFKRVLAMHKDFEEEKIEPLYLKYPGGVLPPFERPPIDHEKLLLYSQLINNLSHQNDEEEIGAKDD